MINRQDAKVAKREIGERQPYCLVMPSPLPFLLLAFLASWRLIHSNSLTLGTANATPMANKTMTAPPAAIAHCAP
jgi:hypothetical protein